MEGIHIMSEPFKIAVKALRKINSDFGKVCLNFEICTHESCRSSHASWETATKALNEIGHLTNNICPVCGNPMGNPTLCIWCKEEE